MTIKDFKTMLEQFNENEEIEKLIIFGECTYSDINKPTIENISIDRQNDMIIISVEGDN